jgi:NADH-quinone oxidoreductase subunit L
MIHDMFFNFVPEKHEIGNSFFSKMKNTIYVLSVKEWNLDFMLHRYLWSPFKWIGKGLNRIPVILSSIVLLLIFAVGLYANLFPQNVPAELLKALPYFVSFGGLVIMLKAFSEKGSAVRAWFSAVCGQLFITLSVALLSDNFGSDQIMIYLSGSVLFSIIGFVCLQRIKAIDNNIDLNIFHGYSHEQPRLGFVFLLSCLGFAGLPFTPTFIGIDILFSNIHTEDKAVIILTSASFVFMEISVLRIYSRIFLGQYKKVTHAMAYRSS